MCVTKNKYWQGAAFYDDSHQFNESNHVNAKRVLAQYNHGTKQTVKHGRVDTPENISICNRNKNQYDDCFDEIPQEALSRFTTLYPKKNVFLADLAGKMSERGLNYDILRKKYPLWRRDMEQYASLLKERVAMTGAADCEVEKTDSEIENLLDVCIVRCSVSCS